MRPKYSLLEVERRWLVDPLRLPRLEPRTARRIDDLYVADSRLRLRAITDVDGASVYKLCKKYGGAGDGEPITNLYLDAAEHSRLCGLPGARVVKSRSSVAGGSLDVFAEPCAGLAIFEIESPDLETSTRVVPPDFVGREITGESRYSGAAIARGAHANAGEWQGRTIYHLTTEDELRGRLGEAGYVPSRFAADGFVHCSAGREMTLAVARDYFSSSPGPVVVIEIAAERLSARLVFEAPAPIVGGGRDHLASGDLFPHVYGPIDRAAVRGVGRLRREGVYFLWPTSIAPLESFS